MEPIEITFERSSLGRIEFNVAVMTGDFKSFMDVKFKLDSGSDFTTASCGDLYRLGYTREFLENCPFYPTDASTATVDIKLRYITNVSIKFGRREIQGCRIFFALDTELRSLFGSDILKYFNWEVSYDLGLFCMVQAEYEPMLSAGEIPLHIYIVEG